MAYFRTVSPRKGAGTVAFIFWIWYPFVIRQGRVADKMKTLGLLGCMSWESAVPYYQIIKETVKKEPGGSLLP